MSLSFRTLYDTLSRGLFGDVDAQEAARPVIGLDMLSSFLPYRVYEPTTRLYLNARSMGFVLNVAPLVGADERTGDLLGQFFSEGLPAGACVQIVHWASPRIGRNIAPWFLPRYARGGVYEAIARRRAACLYDLVWTSGSASAPFHARHHQILISVGVPAGSATSKEELVAVRESLTGVLRSLDVPVANVDPVQLIAFLDDLTSPTTAPQDDAIDALPRLSRPGSRLGARGHEVPAHDLA
jgi:conjugal transfer ATP-binding protein TraC